RKRFADIIERQVDAAATAAQEINDLMPGDREHPGRHGGTAHPGLALQMNGEQNLLQDIFRIGLRRTGTDEATANETAQFRRQQSQKAAIGFRIAGIRGLQQMIPFAFAILAQGSLWFFVVTGKSLRAGLRRSLRINSIGSPLPSHPAPSRRRRRIAPAYNRLWAL